MAKRPAKPSKPAEPVKPVEEPEPPSTQTTRVDTELLRKARVICAHRAGRAGRSLKLADYVDSLLRPAIERDYQKTLEDIRQGNDGE